ncbi:IlvD/Edd family dehydratase [Paraburkholderia phytofirmans]|uniref:Dihydroxy-acid dehydratase n=1 Tax=Paraburkholderia phytofirmans (strain DSM 17436 / LMG 22146 / PsJN) TaxID=398527 RepID=B2T8Q4_PARPJ|nr:IlvD/Edd family dehydratase [Paraburkholderia phytofirmans]ACD20717.1 Dihydroxy-acid dehydratase [Paraburkholderia phytofirmans PsJN]
MSKNRDRKSLRSRAWFNNSDNPAMTALYLERFMNYGLTLEELKSERPVIGIAQTGSDLSPCNRHHVELAQRVKDGIRDAGGIPIEFPVHPIQETVRRPTASLDRNLAYLGLVEALYGYPFDGVVLTTGCDKTTPAMLMGAATVDIPSIVLSGGPMLNAWYKGERAGSGTIIWHARSELAAGRMDYDEFLSCVANSAPSIGHCNSMGTALSMNSLAEVLGMSLPGCGTIPAPYRERGQMAYQTGRQIVQLVHDDVRPSSLLTREAFENAIVVASAIGASTNCPPHINAIARHIGVDLDIRDWDRLGYDIPLLVNCMPAGKYLGEEFHRAGGVAAVVHELLKAGKLHGDVQTVSGKTLAQCYGDSPATDADVIRPYASPLKSEAGFAVLGGNLFDSAVMKTSVISDDFRHKYLENPADPGAFEGRAIVFEGPEDYHDRIDDPALEIDENCILFIRGTGPVGYPGAAEVVNMIPPSELIKRGVTLLPCVGDGRQSGTSASPSILNASPESAIGGGLAILQTGDRVRFDLTRRRADMLVPEDELDRRRREWKAYEFVNQTPWQELHRRYVGQLEDGACLDFSVKYQRVAEVHGVPRDNH